MGRDGVLGPWGTHHALFLEEGDLPLELGGDDFDLRLQLLLCVLKRRVVVFQGFQSVWEQSLGRHSR